MVSYKKLEKRHRQGRIPCGRRSPWPNTLGTTRVPASQAAAPPSHSTLSGAELPQAKKKKQKQKAWHLCMQGHLSCVQLFATLWTVACQGSLSGGSPGKNTGVYGPILVAMAFYISCCPSRQPPWVPGAARTPATQAAAPPPHLASQGRPKSSREVSGANPSGRPTRRGGNRTTAETQGQRG